jgi:hypothetical protein
MPIPGHTQTAPVCERDGLSPSCLKSPNAVFQSLFENPA